jgi:hypothetical protein
MLKIFHISGLNGRLDRHLTQRRLAALAKTSFTSMWN